MTSKRVEVTFTNESYSKIEKTVETESETEYSEYRNKSSAIFLQCVKDQLDLIFGEARSRYIEKSLRVAVELGGVTCCNSVGTVDAAAIDTSAMQVMSFVVAVIIIIIIIIDDDDKTTTTAAKLTKLAIHANGNVHTVTV